MFRLTSRSLICLSMIASFGARLAAQSPPSVPPKYEGLFSAAEAPPPDVLSALETDINAYFASAREAATDRGDLEKKISDTADSAKVPFKVVEAVVRRGAVFTVEDQVGVVNGTIDVSEGGGCRGYALYIPPTCDPSKPTPLVVSLHGTNGDGPTYIPANREECEKRGWLLVAPSADANIGFAMSRPGVALVLECAAEVARRYHVDPNRIYLEGMSMGAHSAWYIGGHYPDRWAAILPRSGAPWLCDKFLDNFLHLPAYSMNGDADPLVDIKLARKGRDALKALGYAFEFREFAGRGHEIFMDQNPAAFDWLEKQVRDPYPKKIVLKTEELIHGRSYWGEIRDWKTKKMSRAHHRGRDKVEIETREVNTVPARLSGAITAQRIELTAQNVARARIYLADALVNLDLPVEIACGGKVLFRKKVERSIPRMLQEAYARNEREMTFANWIDVKLP